MDIKTVKAAMLGVIVGDALGVPVEFMSREDPHRRPGDWYAGVRHPRFNPLAHGLTIAPWLSA